MSYQLWAELFRCVDVDDELFTQASSVFEAAWLAGKYMCVDESMCPSNHRQNPQHVFIIRKPWPHGVKFFVIADMKSYVFKFFMAKRCEASPTDPVLKRQARAPLEKGWRGKKVKHSVPEIMETLVEWLQPGHCIVADSYFGGLEPARVLTERGHTSVLCCQPQRPSFLFNTCLAPAAAQLQHHGEYVSGTGELRWEDRNEAVPFSAFAPRGVRPTFFTSHQLEKLPGKPKNCAVCYFATGTRTTTHKFCVKCDAPMHKHCFESADHAEYVAAGGKNRPPGPAKKPHKK